MCLTRIVNGDRLVETLDWLALYIACEGISFAKHSLASGSSSLEVLPQRHRPVHLSVQSTNKTKHTFEPRTRYCHIHLACTSVGAL